MCVRAGCAAVCCRDFYFTQEVPQKQVLKIFPNAIRMKYYPFEQAGLPEEVYYRKHFLGGCKVRIVGPCPYLNGNDCGIWNEERMPGCSRMKIASDNCVDLRRRDQNIRILSQPQQP